MKKNILRIVYFALIIALSVSFVGCGGKKKDPGKEKLMANDVVVMAQDRVKNANYLPDVKKLVDSGLGNDTETVNVSSMAEGTASTPSDFGNRAISRDDYEKESSSLILDEQLETMQSEAKTIGDSLKEEIFKFIDNAVVFDKWITDSSSAVMPKFKIHYDEANDKVTVWFLVGSEIQSSSYFFDQNGKEVIENYKYTPAVGKAGDSKISSYMKYVEDTEFIMFRNDTNCDYCYVGIENGIVNYTYCVLNGDNIDITAIRQDGDVQYLFFYKDYFEYKVGDSKLFEFVTIPDDHTAKILDHADYYLTANAKVFTSWDYYLPNNGEEGQEHTNLGKFYVDKTKLGTSYVNWDTHSEINPQAVVGIYYALTDAAAVVFDAVADHDYMGAAYSEHLVQYRDYFVNDHQDEVVYNSKTYVPINHTYTYYAYDSELGVNVWAMAGSSAAHTSDKHYIEIPQITLDHDDEVLDTLFTSEDKQYNRQLVIAEKYRSHYRDAFRLYENGYNDIIITVDNEEFTGWGTSSNVQRLKAKFFSSYKDTVLEAIKFADDVATITPDIDLDKYDIAESISSFSPTVTGSVIPSISGQKANIAVNVTTVVTKNVLLEKEKSYKAELVLVGTGNALLPLNIKSSAVSYNNEDMTFNITGTFELNHALTFGLEYKLAVGISKVIESNERVVSAVVAVPCTATNGKGGFIAKNFELVVGEDYTYGYGFKMANNNLIVIRDGVDKKAPVVKIDGKAPNANGVVLENIQLANNATISNLIAKISASDNVDGELDVRLANIAVYSYEGEDEEAERNKSSNYVINTEETKNLGGYSGNIVSGIYGVEILDSSANVTKVIFKVIVA